MGRGALFQADKRTGFSPVPVFPARPDWEPGEDDTAAGPGRSCPAEQAPPFSYFAACLLGCCWSQPCSVPAGAHVPDFGRPALCGAVLLAASRWQQHLHTLAACLFNSLYIFAFIYSIFSLFFLRVLRSFQLEDLGSQGRCIWYACGNEESTDLQVTGNSNFLTFSGQT